MKKLTLLSLLIFISAIAFGQTILISGTVTNEQGKPVPFAFIKDAEHNYATFSDPDGAFIINANPSSRLMATSNNYQESVVKIDNQSSIKIIMKAGGTAATANSANDVFNVGEIGGTDRNARPLARFGTQEEELHGSPYFFKTWVHGYAISNSDVIHQNDSYLFNYEKINGDLLFTTDGQTMRTVDKAQIKQFTLFDDKDVPYTFENVPSIDPRHFLEVLSSGSNYKIYKNLGTKFVKNDFQTNGIVTTGNNYDSYVDQGSYYVVKLPAGKPQKVTLKRKSIKAAFAADADKANKYMSAHDSDDLDDNFLRGLGDFMNN